VSTKLSRRIRNRIQRAGGWIPFSEFMQEALYAPGLGYYETAEVFGPGGDYVTSPGMGPVLAGAIADLLCWGWRQMREPAAWCLVEQGGGDGRLLSDVLEELQRRDCLMPSRVVAIEASSRLRERQHRRYRQAGHEVEQCASWSGFACEQPCIVICNELLDALPVRCFAWRRGAMLERGVAWEDGGFVWRERPLEQGPEIAPGLIRSWPEGYISEWNPNLRSWLATLLDGMRHGYVFCLDYGYAQSEYYRPQRRTGTLLAYLRHRAVEDVLSDPGGRDITAHVDFTALAHAGEALGFETCCWMSQGAWLAQSPSVQELVRSLAVQPGLEAARDMAALRRMMMPQGMGELFKLHILALKAPRQSPSYLRLFDRKGSLTTLPGET